ncbi:MAG: hypothetical protein AB9842_04935 [Bacteroidales bacterium]
MDTNTIRTEIDQILETVNEQWEMIQQNPGHIPQIELDLFQASIRDLYEALINLHRKNDEVIPVPPPQEPKITTEAVPEVIPEPVYQAPEAVIAEPEPEAPAAGEMFEEIPPQPEPKVEGPPVPVITPALAEEPPVQQAFEKEIPHAHIQQTLPSDEFSFRPPKPEPDLFSSGPTISDKLKEEKLTLNEKLQQEKSFNTIGARLHQNPIKDLKSSIGINEKFQFINELFNGSMQDYTQGIQDLNQFSGYEEALKLIDVLKFKYNWDTNSDAYHKIMDFVRRRYM